MSSRKIWMQILTPVAVGLAAGAVALVFYPNLGSGIGSLIYSQGQEPTSYSYAVAKAAPSVVNIYVSTLNREYSAADSTGTLTMSASGVIMSQDGYIATNYHVVPSGNAPDKAIWAQTRDGTVYQAFVVGYDRRTDVAILKIQTNGSLPPIPIDLREKPNVGDVVLAIGNPNNLGQTVTHGIVSATSRSGSGLLTREQMHIREGLQDLIQTDAPINQGNSGGALINTSGNMIGMNTASFTNSRYGTYGIGFAVPTQLVVRVMNEIIQHGRVIRGYLGISDDGTTALSSNTVGVKVGYIDPLGPAAKSELRLGDVIIMVDEKKITNLRNLIDIISSTTPGTVLNFTVKRGHETLQIPITLAEDQTAID